MTDKMAISIKRKSVLFYILVIYIFVQNCRTAVLPLVINTWPFTNATRKAWEVIAIQHGTPMDALVKGCSECQQQQCDGTVGYGGSPDEIGETTLDGMVMDGKTLDVGAVGDLRKVKNVIGVARAVMEYSEHTFLVGESATKFAIEMGFKSESLSTNRSLNILKEWERNNCQPNFRQNVYPDPKKNCGPYKPGKFYKFENNRKNKMIGPSNHDTIGMLIIDTQKNIVGGTSTNGANHKVPGRVGDSPIMGAGAYVKNGVGGAAATGDGDIMMRFLPSFKAVTLLEMGFSVQKAAEESIKPIIQFYPTFAGAVIVASVNGTVGAACHNFKGGFPYSVRTADMTDVQVITVPCI